MFKDSPIAKDKSLWPSKITKPKPRAQGCKAIKYTEEPQTKAELEALVQAAKSTDSLNHIDTSAISDMSKLFIGSTFNGNISCWDTFNVTDMSSMFHDATDFNQNIGNWDTANVIDMSNMFNKATAFNQNIGPWNTSNVTDMSSMFYKATAFNQDISKWKTSNVTDMTGMFYKAKAFSQNISKWDTASVSGSFSMFKDSAIANKPEWWPKEIQSSQKKRGGTRSCNQKKPLTKMGPLPTSTI